MQRLPRITAGLRAFSPSFPLTQRHAVYLHNLEADLRPIRRDWVGRSSLKVAGRGPPRGSIPPRERRIVLALTPDMRHVWALPHRVTAYIHRGMWHPPGAPIAVVQGYGYGRRTILGMRRTGPSGILRARRPFTARSHRWCSSMHDGGTGDDCSACQRYRPPCMSTLKSWEIWPTDKFQ
jgi:hypothetical protein